MEASIVTAGLTKRYGRRTGIEDLDLEVRRGEVFGFLGPNGAGKTTTIRLLLGLIHPTRGTARVLGHDLLRDGPGVRAWLGYLPGSLAFDERATGRELLRFWAAVRGHVPVAAWTLLADRFDLDLDRRVHELSKGNRQKLGIVQAFMHRPDLVLLDEPTSGLDPLAQVQVHQLLREVVAQGTAVLLSSHVLTEVERVADRAGIVTGGRLRVVDTVDRLRERHRRRVELDFDGPPPQVLASLPGVRDVVLNGRTASCHVTGRLTALLETAVRHGVVDVRTHEPDLEDAFLDYVGTETSGVR